MSLRLPEPASFEHLLRPARIEVASLIRLSRQPATEPYWSVGVYRFDDPDPDPGGSHAFGTWYTASTIEVAFAESVIHECGRFVAGSYEVLLRNSPSARSCVLPVTGARRWCWRT